MSAFLRLGDIKGEATDQDHDGWILVESITSPILRSIPEGAVNNQRSRGDTTLGDVVVVRQVDKSTPKLAEACASGTFFTEVEIHLCANVDNKQEPYMKFMLSNVIVTGYTFHGNSTGDPLPTEEVTFGFTEIEWTYVVLDPDNGRPVGNVPAKYNPALARA